MGHRLGVFGLAILVPLTAWAETIGPDRVEGDTPSGAYLGTEDQTGETVQGPWCGELIASWDWARCGRLRIAAEEKPRVCCKTCKKGKACGDSCIARLKTCQEPPGCACDAE